MVAACRRRPRPPAARSWPTRSRQTPRSWRWLETLDTGHPMRDTSGLDVPRTAATFRYFGGMADKFQGSVVPVEPGFLNYVLREPIGVVGPIVPWNFPLMFTSWKIGPALAAGNMRRAEAGRAHAAQYACAWPSWWPRSASRPASSTSCPGYGATAGAAHRRASRRRQDRRSPDRPRRAADRAGLRGQPEEACSSSSAARAPTSSSTTPTSRRGRARLGVRDLPQPGPGVHRRRPAAAARADRRRVPRRVPRARVAPIRLGQPARCGDRDGPADVGSAPRPRAELPEDRRGGGRRGARRRQAAGGPAAWPRAATSSRRSCGRRRGIACAGRRCSAPSSP